MRLAYRIIAGVIMVGMTIGVAVLTHWGDRAALDAPVDAPTYIGGQRGEAG